MRTRVRWALSAAVAAIALFGFQPPVAGQTAKPNIVVFLIDDYDVESLNLLVQKGMMPNLKKYFLDVGFNFTESFSVASLGAPSRATFLTGQYPHNHRVRANFPPNGGVTYLNEASTVATWLRSAGYRTSYVGRYLTGYGWWTEPTRVPPGWDEWLALVDPSSTNMVNYQINGGGTLFDFGQFATDLGIELYQSDMLAWLAGNVIQRSLATPKPFFITVAPLAFNLELPLYHECANPADPNGLGGNIWGFAQRPPIRYMNTIHGNDVDFPLPAKPSFDEVDVEDKPDWVKARPRLAGDDLDCLKRRYWRKLEVMRAVDDQIGYVMGALETAGVLSNTFAIFTGDNGWNEGEHRLPYKGYAYEEAIRVPLLIRPRTSTGPRVVQNLVLNTDLAPTIAQLAGATQTHPVDGRSLVPLLLNPASPWRKMGLLEHVADGGYFGDPNPPNYFGLRTDVTKPRTYVRYPNVPSGLTGELYDLSTDPYQLQNLFADPGRVSERDQLEAWLNAMKTCAGVTCQLLENYFVLR